MLQLVRVYGQAMAQVADAEVRLFHLYVHEPLMRSGSTGVEMAEEMLALSRELLPLASPVMDQVHQRYLQHFVEQDVVGHMEADLDGDAVDLGRMRVAIAFADLAGYTRLTEEEGELRRSTRSSGSSRRSRSTLPDEARVIKTIGDEVMVVGSDPAALTDWAVGFQRLQSERPLPRIGIHYGDALYRDGDYYGRDVNIASRVAARSAGGEVLVTRPVVERGRLAPRVRADRRGEAEGLQRADRDLPRAPAEEERGAMLERGVAPTGLLAAGPPGASCCSPAGATRPACSTWRCGSPAPTRSARCTSTTGCATPPTPTSATAPRCASGSACALEVRRPPRRRRPGTSRPGRATSATARRRELALARGADVAAGHTATDQVETILYRLASSPSRRALLGMRPRDGLLVRPLLGFTREQTAAYCRERGLRLARGREQRRPTRTRAAGSARACAGAARVHPARRGERAGAGRDPARRGGGARRARRRGARGAAARSQLARLRELPPALARLVVQRLADERRRRAGAGVGRRAEEIAALREHGTRGARPARTGCGRSRERRRCCASSGRRDGSTASRARHDTRAMRPVRLRTVDDDDAIGEILVPAEDLAAPGARAGRRRSRATTRARTWC